MRKKALNVKNTNDVDKNIGIKINHLRLSLGVTRQELADELGITHQQLQKYEKGINRISASRLVDISDALQVSVIYFFEDFMEVLDESQIKRQRLCMEIMRDFINIKRGDQQEVIRQLIKVLAEKDQSTEAL